MITKEDIPNYAPATIKLPDGSIATIDVVHDDSMGAPWEEHDVSLTNERKMP